MRTARFSPRLLLLATLALVPALVSIMSSSAWAQGEGNVRRFALIVGANDGGGDRAVLRFANSDAESVAKVIKELGGVEAGDVTVVLQPNVTELEQSLGALALELEEARQAHRRTEVVFYYSGHSDETGILLGSERLPYKKLKLYIQALPADVRVAVLDSCASGALTRQKGGDKKKPFLVNEANEVKGYAFLTSSSADEVAQESDKIGGSFFTHFFLVGLRGAADSTRDGRVTLSEAYDFAYKETLSRTETTIGGAQHANYDIRLTGSGDLVLTDIRASEARLSLTNRLHGRFYVRDSNDVLIAELFKPVGRTIELGVEPGEYRVTLEDKGKLKHTRALVVSGEVTALKRGDFNAVTAEATASRGGEAKPPALERGYDLIPFDLALIPGVQLSGWHSRKTRHNVQLALLLNHTDQVIGIQGSLVGNIANEHVRGAQASAVFNIAAQDVVGGQYGIVFNYAGGQVEGMQVSAGVNYAGGDMSYGQIAPALNFTSGNVFGFQAAAAGNIATDEVFGVQAAAGFNLTGGDVHGVQAAAGFNLAGGDVDGAQVAAGFNLAGGHVNGPQISAGNIAESVDGAQIGVLNIGSAVNGAQVGFINIGGTVDGAQVGLINVAGELNGPPVGLINIIGNGQFHLDVFSDDVVSTNAGIRFGSKHVYTMIGAGSDLAEVDPLWHVYLGLGGHIPIGPLFIDIDLMTSMLQSGELADRTNILNRLRLSLGWQLFGHLAILGGASLNTWIADAPDRDVIQVGPEIAPGPDGEQRSGTTLSVWPGFHLGVQF